MRLMRETAWFTRKSWSYMGANKHPLRFLFGYPAALVRFLRSA